MSECTCWVTDEKYWFQYGSAVEPGSQMEWNPDCPVHLAAVPVSTGRTEDTTADSERGE